jgi:hypothetical protein
MRLLRGLELTSCALCIVGAATVVLAVYRLNLFYEHQSFGAAGSTSIGMTLQLMGTLGGGISALYSSAAWIMTVSALVWVLGGLAIAGAFRVTRARRVGSFAVATCGVVVFALWLLVGSGPGIHHDQPDVTYPRGPAEWVGIGSAGLILVGLALALVARRMTRRLDMPSGGATTDHSVNPIGGLIQTREHFGSIR